MMRDMNENEREGRGVQFADVRYKIQGNSIRVTPALHQRKDQTTTGSMGTFMTSNIGMAAR